MCGLVGVYGVIDEKLKKVFQNLLIVDIVRGPHSTGIGIGNNTNIFVLKQAVGPLALFATKIYSDKIKNKNCLLMGHNRFATKGKITAANAHPFQIKHITLMHNGTLNNVYSLPIDKPENYDTDSEAIAISVAEKGIEKTWEKIYGAATLVFWDSNKKTLNFISDKKRPFFFTRINNSATIIWASEKWMLEGILARYNITIDKNIFFLPSDTLFTFKFNKKKVTNTKEKLKAAPLNYPPSSYTSWPSGYGNFNYKKEKQNNVINPPKPKEKTEDLQAANVYCTYAAFINTYEACVFCGGDLIHAYDSARIIDNYTAICNDCYQVSKNLNINITEEILL